MMASFLAIPTLLLLAFVVVTNGFTTDEPITPITNDVTDTTAQTEIDGTGDVTRSVTAVDYHYDDEASTAAVAGDGGGEELTTSDDVDIGQTTRIQTVGRDDQPTTSDSKNSPTVKASSSSGTTSKDSNANHTSSEPATMITCYSAQCNTSQNCSWSATSNNATMCQTSAGVCYAFYDQVAMSATLSCSTLYPIRVQTSCTEQFSVQYVSGKCEFCCDKEDNCNGKHSVRQLEEMCAKAAARSTAVAGILSSATTMWLMLPISTVVAIHLCILVD